MPARADLPRIERRDGHARVRGRWRTPGGVAREADVDVPGGDALADEELFEAALLTLRERHPGAEWVDPQAAAATAAVSGRRPLAPWLRRFPLYLFLWVVLVIPFAYGAEEIVRDAYIVPACKRHGEARGLAFVSYSHGGGSLGDLLGLTGHYSTPGCYFRGTPSFVTLREIGGGAFASLALLAGTGSVFVGLALDAFVVVLIAWLVERLLRWRRGGT